MKDSLTERGSPTTSAARLKYYARLAMSGSQFEKAEATFFNFEFPANVFHVRQPLLDPLPGTLVEPEIHARLAESLGALPAEKLAPLHAAAALGREAYATAFFAPTSADPELGAMAPLVLYRTLGPTLPAGMASAALLWGAAHRCAFSNPNGVARAGFTGDGLEPGACARPGGSCNRIAVGRRRSRRTIRIPTHAPESVQLAHYASYPL